MKDRKLIGEFIVSDAHGPVSVFDFLANLRDYYIMPGQKIELWIEDIKKPKNGKKNEE